MQVSDAIIKTIEMLENAGVFLSDDEKNRIEIVDFNLGNLTEIGLQLITFVNNERYCSKNLVLFPYQNCPEHRHPPFDDNVGKQETFRCIKGEVFLYVEGKATVSPKVVPPSFRSKWYTVHKEIHLLPGMQYTIFPNTKHWFQAGKSGAVIAEFSSYSKDEFDLFTDPKIVRIKNG